MVDLRSRSSAPNNAGDFNPRGGGTKAPLIRSKEGVKLGMVVVVTIVAIMVTIAVINRKPTIPQHEFHAL